MKRIALLATALWIVALPARSQAQQENLPPSVLALVDEIAEIDKLRTLNPLNLTDDQIDQVIATLKASQKNYNRKIMDLATATISQIAEETKALRPRMLAGEKMPKETLDKLRRLQKEFVAKRSEQEDATLSSLAASLKKILTKDQVKEAIKQARTFAGSGTSGSDDQYYNLYVLTQFILYPRAVPLLEAVKKTRSQAAE